MILEGVLKEGDPLPSVRQVAGDCRLNALTVLKAYQQLVDEQLVESRRGRGMYVRAGAQAELQRSERQSFLESEWPRLRATMARLGLSLQELLSTPAAPSAPGPGKPEDDSDDSAPSDSQ